MKGSDEDIISVDGAAIVPGREQIGQDVYPPFDPSTIFLRECFRRYGIRDRCVTRAITSLYDVAAVLSV